MKWNGKEEIEDMLLPLRPTVSVLPTEFGSATNKPLFLYRKPAYCFSIREPSPSFKSSLHCYCIKEEITDNPTEVLVLPLLIISWLNSRFITFCLQQNVLCAAYDICEFIISRKFIRQSRVCFCFRKPTQVSIC